MELNSNSFRDGERIPSELAFGVPDADSHMSFGDNRNPHLSWSGAPSGTRSYAIVCVDPDVPADASDVNTEGKTLPANAPRAPFYHWLMVDIPAGYSEIDEGACSSRVVKGGKSEPEGPSGSRQGINDYTAFLEGSELAGVYRGYDGPCPPWNDERVHHYHFRVYALDIDHLELPEDFRGGDVMSAIDGHVLDSAEIVGTYTLNRDLL